MKSAEKKGKNKELILKLCLYFISLWFLLFMLIVLTLDVEHFPNALSLGQLSLLWRHNAVALICMVMFGLSLFGLWYFRNLLDDSKRLPVRIVKCESVNYENLSFLATYIIPLVCFPMQTDRQIFVLFSVIIIMGCIFAKKLTNKNVGSKAFKGIYAKATIKVPKSKLTSYKKLLKAKGLSKKAKIKK